VIRSSGIGTEHGNPQSMTVGSGCFPEVVARAHFERRGCQVLPFAPEVPQRTCTTARVEMTLNVYAHVSIGDHVRRRPRLAHSSRSVPPSRQCRRQRSHSVSGPIRPPTVSESSRLLRSPLGRPMQSIFGRVARSTVGHTKDHTRADAPVGERGIALNRYPVAPLMGIECGRGVRIGQDRWRCVVLGAHIRDVRRSGRE